MSASDTLVETFPVGPLGCNCSIVGDRVSGKAVIVDPGDDHEDIVARVRELGLKVVALVHTHAHIDHINGTAGVQAALGAPAELHEADLPLYEGVDEQMRLMAIWGLSMTATKPPEPGRFLVDGDVVGCDACAMQVLHTPGHTPGSLSFLLEIGNRPVLFSGDTLFAGGIGRTDLWGGDGRLIQTSIRERLFTLGDDTVVVPGHGELTTIGEERRGNPHVKAH